MSNRGAIHAPPEATGVDAALLLERARLDAFYAAPEIRFNMLAMVATGVWVAAGKDLWVPTALWALVVLGIGQYWHLMARRFRAQRDGGLAVQPQRWLRLMQVIPVWFSLAFVLLLLLLFAQASPVERLALGFFGCVLGVAATSFFALSGPGMLLVCLLGQAAVWWVWGADWAVGGTLATLALLVYLLPMHRAQARSTLERVRVELRAEQLTRELAARNAELEAQEQQRNLLLATASHDLRQPVYAMELLLDNSATAAETPTQRATLLQTLQSQTMLLADMLGGLLDMSQLRRGTYTLHARPFDIGELLHEVAGLFEGLARRKGLEFDVQIAPARGITLVADRGLLGRVVSNLVSNAVKYTSQGQVRLQAQPQADGGLQLVVTDTGVGMTRESQQLAFTAYVRVGSSEQQQQQAGVGIGLSVVERACELMGMGLAIESAPGQGSRFTLAVPAGLVQSTPQSLPAAPDAAELAAPFPPARVLLVDDDDAIRQASIDLWRQWGLDARAVADEAQAQALLSEAAWEPELLVCGYQLARGHNGLDCMAALRERMQRPLLPAVLLTGDLTLEERRIDAVRPTVVAYKPLHPQDLRALLMPLLHKERARG